MKEHNFNFMNRNPTTKDFAKKLLENWDYGKCNKKSIRRCSTCDYSYYIYPNYYCLRLPVLQSKSEFMPVGSTKVCFRWRNPAAVKDLTRLQQIKNG